MALTKLTGGHMKSDAVNCCSAGTCSCRRDKPSRRTFLSESIIKLSTAISGAAILSFLTQCSKSKNPVSSPAATIQIDTSLPAYSALAATGGIASIEPGTITGLPPNGVFVIRTSATAATALDRTCTHQGCEVGPFQSNGIATCPCHGSQFNASGGVVNGPATSALKKYTATISGSIIQFSV
jgi:Rieske Fe-S protein